jgi:hypothetical protein
MTPEELKLITDLQKEVEDLKTLINKNEYSNLKVFLKAVIFKGGFVFGDGATKTEPTGILTHKYTLAGTNTFSVVVSATASNGQSVSKTISVSVTVVPGAPTLYWAEEFDGNGAPNSAIWGYDLGNGQGGVLPGRDRKAER